MCLHICIYIYPACVCVYMRVSHCLYHTHCSDGVMTLIQPPVDCVLSLFFPCKPMTIYKLEQTIRTIPVCTGQNCHRCFVIRLLIWMRSSVFFFVYFFFVFNKYRLITKFLPVRSSLSI